MMMKYNQTIGVAILVGGYSSRMGKAKEKLPISGDVNAITFLQHLCNEFSVFEHCYLSENGTQNHHICGYESIKDEFQQIGPLGGIYSVLSRCDTDAVLFIACDMPLCVLENAKILIDRWDGSPIAIPQVDGRRQPLFGIYTKECLPYIKKLIEKNSYKIGILIDQLNGQIIDMSEFHENFANVNTEEEYNLYLLKSQI